MKRAWTLMLAVLAACVLLVSMAVRPPTSRADDGPAPTDSTEWQQWIDRSIPAPILPPAPSPPNVRLAPERAALWRSVLSPPAGDPLFDQWPTGLDASIRVM